MPQGKEHTAQRKVVHLKEKVMAKNVSLKIGKHKSRTGGLTSWPRKIQS